MGFLCPGSNFNGNDDTLPLFGYRTGNVWHGAPSVKGNVARQ
jgi:hypothetical protein